MQIKVRIGRREDAARVEQYNIFTGERIVDIERGECYVAEVNGRVDGFITLSSHWFYFYPIVVFLCVAPEARRQGIGEMLLDYIEKRVLQPRLFISTEEDNVAMHTLLSKRKWIKAGTINGLNSDGMPEVFYYKDLNNEE